MKMRCLYCGKNELNIPGNPYLSQNKTKDPYTCDFCHMQCTQTDIDMDSKRLKNTGYFQGMVPAVQSNEPDEEKLLSSAWELMQKRQWGQAGEILGKKSYPFKHALEFLFYRGICQTAVLFSLPEATPSDRCRNLDILINNLNNIDFFEPDDHDETFKTLKRVADAFLLLGDLTIEYPSASLKDHTNYRRAIILSGLADILEFETIGNPKYCADYLKLGVQLLHKSLELAKEKPVKFVPYFEEQLCLPTSERVQINAKIKYLNKQIKMRDPQFRALPPPPLPKVMPRPLVKLMKLSVALVGACFAFYIVFLAGRSFVNACSIDAQEFADIMDFLFWGFIILVSIIVELNDNMKESGHW